MGFDPVTMGLVALQTGVSAVATNSAALAGQNAAISAAQLNYKLEEQKQQEIRQQAGMKLSSEAIKRVQERGKIIAAGADSGVSGISPARTIADSYIQESFTKGSIINEQESKLFSSSLNNISTYSATVSKINELESQKATPLSMVTKLALGATGSYLLEGGTVFGYGNQDIGKALIGGALSN
jgi:hypothetical protein